MKTKKNLNRRDFIGLSVTGSILLVNNRYELKAQTQQCRIRKNIECLTSSEKDVLKKVVQTMKKLSISDPQSYKGWVKQVEIHKSRCNLDDPEKNVHATWLFLPWHRAYLYYFEEICRTLPGCSNFTIPYWDWTNPNARKLPSIFLEDPLAHSRPGTSNHSEAREDSVGQVAMHYMFGKDFWTFTGNDPSSPAGRSAGVLEYVPHNHIHTGFIGGDMGNFSTAPLDPIFWSHHANVDRLWTQWMNMHGTPQNKVWAAKTVDGFYNPDDTQVPGRTVGSLLSTYSLDYRYDDQSEQPLKFGNSSEVQKVSAARIWTEGEVGNKAKKINGVLSVNFSDMFKTAQKPNKSVVNISDLSKEVKKISKAKQTSKPSSEALLLIVELGKPANSKIAVKVFVNAPQNLSELSIDSPSYLTRISFFEGKHNHDNHDKDEMSMVDDDSRKFIMNLTSNIQELSRLNPPRFVSFEETTISIVPTIREGDSDVIVEGIKLKSLKFIIVK